MPRAWLLLLLSLLLVGCAKDTQLGGEIPSHPVFKVVSLSPSTTEILAQDGNEGQLVGRTSSDNFPPFLGASVPVVAGVKPDYEKLTAIKPNLIVYDNTLYSPADIEKMKSIGAELFEFKASTLDEFIAQLKVLGTKVDAPLAFSKYVDKLNQAKASAIAAAPKVHPKVIVLTGSYAAGTKSFIAELVQMCGGQLIGPDADRFMELNPEAVIQANPDIVFLALDASRAGLKKEEAAGELLTKFKSDPRYKSLSAVTKNRVYPIDEDVLLRKGMRVDLLITAFSKSISAAEE